MDKNIISGYALLWGVPYDMGGYSEQIAQGALDGVDFSECRLLFNHDTNYLLATVKSGTLSLKIDYKGLQYRAELPDTSTGLEIAELVFRGDLNQSSWGFSLSEKGKRWSNDGEMLTITRIKNLWDVSVVTFPANPHTTAFIEASTFTGRSFSTQPPHATNLAIAQEEADFKRREALYLKNQNELNAARMEADFKRREEERKHSQREESAKVLLEEMRLIKAAGQIDYNSPAEIIKHFRREQMAYKLFESLRQEGR